MHELIHRLHSNKRRYSVPLRRDNTVYPRPEEFANFYTVNREAGIVQSIPYHAELLVKVLDAGKDQLTHVHSPNPISQSQQPAPLCSSNFPAGQTNPPSSWAATKPISSRNLLLFPTFEPSTNPQEVHVKQRPVFSYHIFPQSKLGFKP